MFSPEGMPPGSVYRHMTDKATTMYGDHVVVLSGDYRRQRAQSAMPARRCHGRESGGRESGGQESGGHVAGRPSTARVDTVNLEQSYRRPTTAAFSTSWTTRNFTDSDLSTSGSQISDGRQDNKPTALGVGAIAWQDTTGTNYTREQPRHGVLKTCPPAYHDVYDRKVGKSADALAAQSVARQRQVMQMKMMINEQRRDTLLNKLRQFWTLYPLEEWRPD